MRVIGWLLRMAECLNFGDASFWGSAGSIHLDQPVVGIKPSIDGRGYWMVAADGGVFNYGSASFSGSAVGAIKRTSCSDILSSSNGPRNLATVVRDFQARGPAKIFAESAYGNAGK